MVLFAPLVSGLIQKMKNVLRMRQGPGIFQPYYNMIKLISKDEVVSKNVSWIFYAAPPIALASSVCASFLVLMLQPGPFLKNGIASLIAAFFVLSLGRFFMALAGLDAAGAFGGMGSSREMFISSFVEPVVFISAFVLCSAAGVGFRASGLLAGVAMFMVILAETTRIPIDNRETHLELTMVHEAMILEYSGRSLALIELSGQIKQILFFIILSWYFFPVPQPGWAGIMLVARILLISLVVAFIEISLAKMRLFRAVDFLSFAFFIALVASIVSSIGL